VKASLVVLDNGYYVFLPAEPSERSIGGTAIHYDDLVGNRHTIVADTLNCSLEESLAIERTQDNADMDMVCFVNYHF
jgi:hypothetical protein